MHEAVYLVVGAFLAGIVGILTNRVERWRSAKEVSTALKIEICLNNRIIKTRKETIGYWGGLKDISKTEGEIEKYIDTLPDSFRFHREVFNALCGEIGSLKSETASDIIRYYAGFAYFDIVWLGAVKSAIGGGESNESMVEFERLADIHYQLGEKLQQSL